MHPRPVLVTLILVNLFVYLACDNAGKMITSESVRCVVCHPGTIFEDTPVADSIHQGLEPISMEYYSSAEETLSARQCQLCHKKEYDAWKKSKHSHSMSNPVFRAALVIEPDKWCINCHAPLSTQAIDIDANGDLSLRKMQSNDLTGEGINCAACHIRNGMIYTYKKPSEISRKKSIHPIQYDASLSDSRLCRSCHQFPFPKSFVPEMKYSDSPMQNTFEEYHRYRKEKKSDKKSCRNCHYSNKAMAGHTLLGVKELLTNPKHFQASFRTGIHSESNRNYVLVRIKVPEIGHCLPTGDLFRTLQIDLFDATGALSGTYRIENILNRKEHTTETDTRLCPENDGIDRTIRIFTSDVPERCKISYRYQGGIEKLIYKRLHYYSQKNHAALSFIFHEASEQETAKFTEQNFYNMFEDRFTLTLYDGKCQ